MTDNTILFISHKQSDSTAEFKKPYEHLRTHYDKDEIYIDLDSNQPGRSWLDSQQAALEACVCLLVVVGKDWTPGQWISHELATAYERKIPVIPVGIGAQPNFMGAEALEKLVKDGLELLEAPYTHDLAITADIKHLFEKQAAMVADLTSPSELEKLDRLIWSQALMPPIKGKLPAGSHLPFPRNQVFTGRVKDLLTLAKLAMEQHPSTLLVTQLVEGMGGIGKTQVAVEFCYRYGRFFQGVHWLNLRDPNAFAEQVAENGRQMFGKEVANMELPELVRLTLAQWEQEGPRLIVFDNLEDEKAYVALAAQLSNTDARILLTARNTAWGAGNIHPDHRLPLGCFTRAESLAFLREVLDEKYSKEQLDALARRMGDLPLALELASAYLRKQKIGTIEEYFAKLDTQALEHRSLNLIGEQTGYTGHDLNLGKTFLVSYDALKEENSQTLFKAAAFIAPNQPFPAVIFKGLYDGEDAEESLNAALHAVESASLVDINNGWLSIHPLLAEFGQRLDGATDALEKLARVLAWLSRQVGEGGLPRQFEPLLPHFLSVAEKAAKENFEVAAPLLNNIGSHYQNVGAYSRALDVLSLSLEFTKRHFGDEHSNTASVINNLGLVLQAMGDYAGAQAHYERALIIDEAAFGSDHPNVAIRVNNLGLVLQAMGAYGEAKAHYERALRILEAALGENHPQVATGANNLGSVLQAMGDYAGARAMYERALKIDEAAFGPDLPNVATRVNNLGSLHLTQEQFTQAIPLFQRALEILSRTHPENHPWIQASLNSLTHCQLGLKAQELGISVEELVEKQKAEREAQIQENE